MNPPADMLVSGSRGAVRKHRRQILVMKREVKKGDLRGEEAEGEVCCVDVH